MFKKKSSFVNVYSYVSQARSYDMKECKMDFELKFGLKFDDLRFLNKQMLDGYIKYIHPNDNIYIYNLLHHNWSNIDDYIKCLKTNKRKYINI